MKIYLYKGELLKLFFPYKILSGTDSKLQNQWSVKILSAAGSDLRFTVYSRVRFAFRKSKAFSDFYCGIAFVAICFWAPVKLYMQFSYLDFSKRISRVLIVLLG